MAKKKGREQIHLECTNCGDRNYHSEKNKVSTTARIELKKYCKRCKKAVVHKETK